jgi:hypothetical protein
MYHILKNDFILFYFEEKKNNKKVQRQANNAMKEKET